MNTQAHIFGVSVGAYKHIRALKLSLDRNEPENLLSLIQLLHATLDADELVACLHQGSQLERLPEIRPAERVKLLQYAERWGTDARDIERISDTFAAKDLREDTAIGAIVSGARKRLLRRAQLMAGPAGRVAMFSIGADCLPWIIPNRWGLRRAEDIPKLFTPLSLAVHRPKFMVKMIENGFDGYLDSTMLMTTLSTGGFEIVARADGGALWNHCVGSFWSHRDFRKFDRIMSRRLERFLVEAFGESGEFRVFLFNLPNAPTERAAHDQIAATAAALALRVKGPHGLIAIDSNRRRVRSMGVSEIAPAVAIVQAPPPTPHYSWCEAKDYDRAEGIDYEFCIVNLIQTCVTKWTQGHD